MIALIKDAFKGVQLGDGVSLHETIEIDNFRMITDGSTAREKDEKYNWEKLISMPAFQNMCWNGGISFFDSKGLRFHLPAYMILVTQEREGDLFFGVITRLTHATDFINILNEKQRYCVQEFLLYLLDRGDINAPQEIAEIEKSLTRYWSINKQKYVVK